MPKAIYRIYRPKTFKEVSGQKHVVRTVQNQHAAETVAHAYLFTGPRGVGKTTIARLLAKLVNCEDSKESEPCNACNACEQVAGGNSLDVYEIDAASHTDVENVRENIIKSVRFAPNQLKKKVYIIDEVHMLSTSAFNALLKTLEEPPEHALFILATTEIHKVPETIISRCQRFDFGRIEPDEMVERLKGIVKNEKVDVDEDVLREVVRHSDGCARDAESLLGQVLALGEKKISMAEASLVLPTSSPVQVQALIDGLKNQDAAESVKLLNEVLDQGMDLPNFVGDVIHELRDLLMSAVSAGSKETLFFEYAVSELLDAQSKVRYAHIPQLPIELAIVKICRHASPLPKKEKSDFPNKGVDSGRDESTDVEAAQQTSVAESSIGSAGDTSLQNRSDGSEREVSQQPIGDLDDVDEKEVSVSFGVDGGSLEEEMKVEVVDRVFDAVPVIDIDEIKGKWPKVFEQIKQCNASLPLMMRSCEISGMNGDQVELAFDFDLYVQTVNKEKNRHLIEGVLEEVLGQKLRVRAVSSPKRAENDDVVQGLVQDFGGSVV
jgi:DNA polymerase III subunit gamma/tau